MILISLEELYLSGQFVAPMYLIFVIFLFLMDLAIQIQFYMRPKWWGYRENDRCVYEAERRRKEKYPYTCFVIKETSFPI